MKIIPLIPLLSCSCVFSAQGDTWKKVNAVSPDLIKGEPKYSSLLEECRYDRYMEGGEGVALKDLPNQKLPPGWETVRDDERLRLYRYTVFDKKKVDGKWVWDPDKKRAGLTIDYSPSPERVAAWIVNALSEVAANLPKTFSAAELREEERGIASYIRGSSHSQFPVVGTVWEDYPSGGSQEGYRFLDGISISTKSIPLEGYYKPGFEPAGPTPANPKADYFSRLHAPLGERELQHSLSATWTGTTLKTGSYARIAATSRTMVVSLYRRMGKTPPFIDGTAYPADYIRGKHIEAMNSSRNELIVAYVLHRHRKHP